MLLCKIINKNNRIQKGEEGGFNTFLFQDSNGINCSVLCDSVLECSIIKFNYIFCLRKSYIKVNRGGSQECKIFYIEFPVKYIFVNYTHILSAVLLELNQFIMSIEEEFNTTDYNWFNKLFPCYC